MCTWPAETDSFVSKEILNGGVWEPKLVALARDVMKEKKKGILLDVGANIGQYTLLGAALGHTVIAVEPISEHVKMISLSAKLNGFQDRIHIFRNAASDYVSKSFINIHKTNKGGSTIDKLNSTEDETVTDPRFYDKVEIDLFRLDDILPFYDEYFPDLDLIFWKADIEGYEPRMFRGAFKLIADKKPPFIVFELLGKSFARTQCSFSSLLPALRNLGYKIKNMEGNEWSDERIDSFASEYPTEYKLKKLSQDIVLEIDTKTEEEVKKTDE